MEPASDNRFVRARRKAANGSSWVWRQTIRPFTWGRHVALRAKASRKAWGPAALFALLGVAAVLASIAPGPGIDDGWMRDLLLTIGSSLALFAPLYFITRTLDTHLGEVATETREQVAEVRVEAAATQTALTEKVEALRADVERKLSDVSAQVTERLKAEAAADTDAFGALRTNATREIVLDALERADRLGLTTLSHPPRVNVCDSTRLYVSAQFDAGEFADQPLMLRVENTNGTVLEWIEWPETKTPEEALFEVGRAIYKITSETFSPARLFIGLADLLDAASSSTERRPAIELCPPQWMVCDDWVGTSGEYGGAYPYGLTIEHLRPGNDLTHIYEKTWVDGDSFDQARSVALALFPDRDGVWNVFRDGGTAASSCGGGGI